MKNLLGAIIFSVFCLTYWGCNIINPDEQIPTFLQIDSFDVLSVAPGTHGSVSKNITDVWVRVNGFSIGNFELPASVPIILEEGVDSANLSITAGIKVNGMSSNRRRYVLYETYASRFGKQPGKTIDLVPQIQYRTTNKYPLLEDFETGNSFVKTSNADTGIASTSDALYHLDGSNGGLMYMDNAHKTGGAVTIQKFTLPGDNKESYMELDYKNTVPFSISAQVTAPNTPALVFSIINISARPDWNKIYINLTDIATTYPGRDVSFIVEASLPVSLNSAYVAIDNLKIITQ